MRFHVENFGCRTNQAEGTSLAAALATRGYESSATPALADLVILNTCTVTEAAERQVRERIRAVHRERPGTRIVVTGCYAQRAPAELAALPGVTCVVGNSHKQDIPTLLDAAPPDREVGFVPLAALTPDAARTHPKIITGDILAAATLAAPELGLGDTHRTRPVLKIQDGCNHRCAYCVIPFVRGRSRSLPPETVLEVIRRWVEAGIKEVVLSGIDLGSYGRDLAGRPTLPSLTARILEETTLPRLRFSSIEPADLTSDFVRLLAASDRIARHLHVPLQSGSDRILRRMHRSYRASDYAERIREASASLANAGLGADVLVGFPGETEDDFGATCALIEQLPFSYLHVFSFSRRPGTRAWAMPDPVPAATIQQRARTLRALAAQKQQHFRAAQVGRVLRVLTLQRRAPDGRREALSENYLKVILAGPDTGPNQLLRASITALENDRLVGTPLAASA